MTDIRDDAFEMFMAEASRLRVRDRIGPARVRLRCGVTHSGTLGASTWTGDVDGHVSLESSGRVLLVAMSSIVVIHGGTARLRDESGPRAPRTLTSVLRELWSSGARVRALLADSRWIDGSIVLVASDYVELRIGDGVCTIPLSCVEAWDVGRSGC